MNAQPAYFTVHLRATGVHFRTQVHRILCELISKYLLISILNYRQIYCGIAAVSQK